MDGRSGYENQGRFQSDGWLVSSFVDNVSFGSPTGQDFVLFGKQKDSNEVINCHAPVAEDFMHCRLGAEHTLLICQGKLHLCGVEDGEDVTLGPLKFVQIKAGHYYQLQNPGPRARGL